MEDINLSTEDLSEDIHKPETDADVQTFETINSEDTNTPPEQEYIEEQASEETNGMRTVTSEEVQVCYMTIQSHFDLILSDDILEKSHTIEYVRACFVLRTENILLACQMLQFCIKISSLFGTRLFRVDDWHGRTHLTFGVFSKVVSAHNQEITTF